MKIFSAVTALVVSFSAAVAFADDRAAFLELCRVQDSSLALSTTFEGLRNIDWEGLSEDCGELYDALVGREEMVLEGGTFQHTNVVDLTPFSFLPNLKRLVLTGQEHVRDLSPLSRLQLEALDLTEVEADLEPLAGILSLRVLSVVGGDQSLAPLAGLALTQLTVEHLNDAAVPALEAIPTLANLTLGRDYGLPSRAPVPDLNRLTGLRSLTIHDYDLDLNRISALRLIDLSVTCSVAGGCRIDDIDSLRQITSLENLTLYRLNLVNTWFLNALPKLQTLDLSGNQLVRFDVGTQLPDLRKIVANDNRIELIYELNAPNLEELELAENRVTSSYWSYFPSFQRLRTLNLNDNRVVHLRGLNLPALQELQATRNVIAVGDQVCIASVSCDFADQLLN
jgi:Leucine-rich repeat (LRR) protein